MIPTPPGRMASITGRLGFRFAFLLAISLLPLGIIATAQSNAVQREAKARSEAALMGETLRAATPERGMIEAGRATAAALAGILPALLDNPAECSAAMARVVERSAGTFSFASFIDPSGRSDCNARGETFEFGVTENVASLNEQPRPMISINREAPVSGKSVVLFLHPVVDEGGLKGYASVSMPHSELVAASERDQADNPHVPIGLLTFDSSGAVLTSSVGMDAAPGLLPADTALKVFVSDEPVAFTRESVSGEVRAFSVVPLIPGQLYALGTWPADGQGGLGGFEGLSPLLFPALMWIASLIVAWLAAEVLVTRPIRRLRHAMRAFAGGARAVVDPDVQRAPLEIRGLSESFLRMAETILHDEAELEDTVHQKEVLLREVHHRVKNNLQLIASIMSLQMRQAQTPEAKALMKGVQDRVMSLATVHRGLYQTSGLTDVRADELLGDIVRQIVSLGTGPGRQFKVETAFDEIRLTPDQAVPLALFLTEALTNAMKYATVRDCGRVALDVTLKREGEERAALEISNSLATDGEAQGLPEPRGAAGGTGLGTHLLSSFASQLGGRLVREQGEGRYIVRIVFDVRPLHEAEARTDAGDAGTTDEDAA